MLHTRAGECFLIFTEGDQISCVHESQCIHGDLLEVRNGNVPHALAQVIQYPISIHIKLYLLISGCSFCKV